MKIHLSLSGLLVMACALNLVSPRGARAIDDEEFKALKEIVTKQGQRIDQLEKVHVQDQQTIDQSQKSHAQDQQEIQRLKQAVQETQKTATDAQKKAETAAQVQPIHPVPEGPDATHNFTMVGDAEVQFGKVYGQHNAFVLADFAPIFLFRARDNILFEAGFDISLQNGDTPPNNNGASTSINLSFATLDYLFNDYVTFVGGYMLLPLGTYSERTAGWLNKIPDDPLARDLIPGAGAGIQLRGAIPVGQSGQSFNYTVYGANGPSSIDGTGNHDQLDLGGNVGIKSDGAFGNLHGSPSGGGRLGWFYPWKPHYDIELGLSGQAGTWDNADSRLWSATAFDAAVHVSPYFEVKGEYIHTWVETDDLGTIRPWGWWVQAGYKLAGLQREWPFINNVELVGRYDHLRDGVSARTDRYTLGYVYYLTNTLLFEGDYEFLSSNDPEQNHDQWIFQLSYGF